MLFFLFYFFFKWKVCSLEWSMVLSVVKWSVNMPLSPQSHYPVSRYSFLKCPYKRRYTRACTHTHVCINYMYIFLKIYNWDHSIMLFNNLLFCLHILELFPYQLIEIFLVLLKTRRMFHCVAGPQFSQQASVLSVIVMAVIVILIS